MFIRKELLGSLRTSQQLENRLSQLSLSKRAQCVMSLVRRTHVSTAEKQLLLSLPEHITSGIIEELREVGILTLK